MPSLFNKISNFARGPQGKRFANKAQSYAKSPEGKRQIDGLRRRFAKKR
jgi:hypothetical protein